MTQYALALCGAIDELLLGVFPSELAVRAFAHANPPTPVGDERDGDSGPLVHAYKVRGCGPSTVFGYTCTELVDGRPTRTALLYWGATKGGKFVPNAQFDPLVPLFD